MAIQIITQGFQAAERALTIGPRMIRQETEDLIKGVAHEVEADVKEQHTWNTGEPGTGGKDVGTAQRAIHTDFSDSPQGDFMAEILPGVDYHIYIEKGTRPHWPPIKALEGWARRHGTNAYLVARAISRRGTKGIFAFEKAFKRLEARRGKLVQDLGREIIVRLRW